MLSLQEISDRLEIQEVLVNYSVAVDGHDWALFDQVFTEAADLDYTEIAAFRGNRQALRDWLSNVMPAGRCYYHMTATAKITLHGDTAEAVTPCYNPIVHQDSSMDLYGHWYRDVLVRTPEGWRISQRYFEVCYKHPLPAIERDE